jgi:putative endonuclease
MYTFYVLQSKRDDKLYLGSTKDFERRFDEHCAGLVASTRNRRPLEIVYKEELATKKEAMAREKYFKGGGKAHYILKNLIQQQVA